MTDTSSNLGLPYIAAGQALKHITHNEALQALDALVQIGIVSRAVSAPPGSPAEGDRYIVGSTASGDWVGKETQIAAFQNGAWEYYTPQIGWLVWDADENDLVVWTGVDWDVASGAPVNPTPLVGVNTTADATNKFAVKSDAILLSHDDVTPGSGDMQVNLNKAADTNTGSMLFQTNWSGRAEFGLTGDDDWHVKVSPDGSAWQEALVADKDTGTICFPQGIRLGADNAANQLGFFEQGTWTPGLSFVTPGNLAVAYSNQTGKFIRIGGLVIFNFLIVTSTFTHSTASSYLKISGFPYAMNAQFTGAGTLLMNGWTKAGYTQLNLHVRQRRRLRLQHDRTASR